MICDHPHFFPPLFQVAVSVAEDSLRPSVPDGLHPGLQDLMRACYDPEPGLRPSFAMIVEHLERLVPELAAAEVVAAGGGKMFGRLFGKTPL